MDGVLDLRNRLVSGSSQPLPVGAVLMEMSQELYRCFGKLY